MNIRSYLMALCLVVTLAGCSSSASKQNSSTTGDAGTENTANCKYTCTMHPKVCSDKPGLCPKCGMDLVEKE
ncbi:hypothetical protein KHS38_10555 [Mucilaginibacter sp. Bleaf8]|uniref:heavy metal-binding domain-containing protein n=1 Tax=Mucilaginibacter sp. Bleaf8 TaxID=2834430 RepID=UPI001BCD7FE0|nr:heavy metal-binding domain-containing protein [Mucilaginibacter sp. Bleaf8]MBS7564845.1 hypothetical protein [Mucilaginibacter sp. Bleaf8]